MADNVIVRVPEQQFIRGEDGYSPEVTIENIDHGHSVTITDRDHTTGQSFNVMDGDSAYEQAVAGGYEGTEAQFNEELASFKELSDEMKEVAPFYAEYGVTTKAEIAAAINGKRQVYLRVTSLGEAVVPYTGTFMYSDIWGQGTGYGFAFTDGTWQYVYELKGEWTAHTNDLNAPAQRAEDAAGQALTRMNSADASAQAAAGSAGDASTAATTATTKAGEASDSATAADGSAKDSEAYAIGKRGGTDVGSTDPAYHNNAKYYAEQAALIVDDVEQVMTPTTIGPTALATFDASVAGMPLKGLTVNIEPVQSGSGDPSPDNVRPITGWTGATVNVSPTTDAQDGNTYSITFPTEAGTIYGGTLDVVNGVLKVTHAITTVSAKTWRYESNYTRFNAGFANIVVGKYGTRKVPFMCSAFQPIDDGRSLTNVPNNSIYGAGTSATVFIKTDTVSTVEDFISTYGNVQILYELAEPLVYDIADIHDVLTLLGTNNIWADTGDVTVTYGAYLETVKNYADRAEDAQEAAEQAQEAAEAVLASIPADYTELSADVDDLKSAINNITGTSILAFVPGCYPTGTLGNTIDISEPTPFDGRVCTKARILPGDSIYLNVSKGTSSLKACAITDENFTVIYRYNLNTAFNGEIVAPTGSAWVVVNTFSNYDGYYAYLGITNFSDHIRKLYKRTNVITPELFGAVGDGVTDDTTAWQSAVNNGNNIVALNKQYKCGKITVNRDANIDCNMANFYCTDNELFHCEGGISTQYSTGDYSAFGAYNLASPNGGYTGLMYLKGTNNIFKQRSYYGGSLEYFNQGKLIGNIPIDITDVSAYRIEPIMVAIKNIKNIELTQTGRPTGITLKYCINSVVENVNMNTVCFSIVTFDRCYKCKYCNSIFSSPQFGNAGDNYYPIYISECNEIAIVNVTGSCAGWHCVSTLGETLTRHTLVKNCTFVCETDIPAYFDHECGIETSIINSILSSVGVSVLSTIKNSSIISTRTGFCSIACHMSSVEGLAVYLIDGCKFIPASNAESKNGVRVYCAPYSDGLSSDYYFESLTMINCTNLKPEHQMAIKSAISQDITGQTFVKKIATINSGNPINIAATETIVFPPQP